MSRYYQYTPSGVCCKKIEIEIEEELIKSVTFQGGCHGNLQGIASLVEGQNLQSVAAKLKGIRCGSKTSSCPDQLAKALEEIFYK